MDVTGLTLNLFHFRLCSQHTAAVVKRKGDRRKTYPGELYAWGDNSVGQLGYQEPKTITLPIFVKGLKDASVASVACGRHHTLALTEEGKVRPPCA